MATERRAQRRNRNSAKRAGAAFEIRQAEYLVEALENPFISRQDKNGSADLGDLAFVGFRGAGINGVPFTMELKNTSSMNLTSAHREAEVEAANYREKHGGHHPFPVVMHKRHGVAAPGKQWVTMTVEQFVRLLQVAEGVDTEPFGE